MLNKIYTSYRRPNTLKTVCTYRNMMLMSLR